MLLKQNINVKSYRLIHPFIDSINLYKFTDNKEHLFVPEGCFELIFQLNGKTEQKFLTTQAWDKRPDYFVGGLHNKAYLVKPQTKNLYSIGIKLKPDTTNIIFKDNLNRFKNQIVETQDVLDYSLKLLIKNLNYNHSFDKTCSLILYYFNSFYSAHLISKNPINTSQIAKHQGRISISELSKKLNLSDSHYRKLFRETIGLSPREYSKIIRVNSAIRYLETNKNINLTKAALDLGYFDQSHFIKEFKSVINLTPSSFINN